MNPNEWQQIKEIFNAAIDLPENERALFLETHDENILQQVRKLLKANENAHDFIVESAFVDVGLVDENETDFYIGKQIDDYKILEEIGRGGMGTVYLAERADESYSKKVAIKLIRRGMDTSAVLKRFVMERKILAGLENPNIAGLLDGGSTSDGLPYLVMEYIEGLPVTRFCDLHRFSIEERLELFRKICAAVSYAHQNLVIHRDLKPSNILVTDGGEPKLLDFGIAKLLNPDWSLETNEATGTMFRLMTPEYASPEQIRGLTITTASDVYSLGVLLYELLSGMRPYKIESRLPQEVAQVILTQEPIRPSEISNFKFQIPNSGTKSETNSNQGQQTTNERQITNPKSKIQNLKSLKGDLDNIILKALRKEPERRYQSVQELSEDIRRHTVGLPVTATADTIAYRLDKFIKRHRLEVFAGILIGIILLTATVITTRQTFIATRERDKAERRFNETRKIANSLLFEIHDSLSDLPGATRSRELLVKRALEYLNTLSAEAGDNPELLLELSIAYRKIAGIQGDPYSANTGNISEATESYKKSLELQEKLLSIRPDDLKLHREILKTALDLGDNLFSQGNYSEAQKVFVRAIDSAKIAAEKEPQTAAFKTNLSLLYLRLSWLDSADAHQSNKIDYFELAKSYSEEALALSPEDEDVINTAAEIFTSIGNNLGNPDYNDLGKTTEAIPFLQKTLSIRQRLADKYPNSNSHLNLLGIAFKDLGDIFLAKGDEEKATQNYKKALEIHKSLAEKDDKNALARATVAYDLTKLGNALLKKGEIEQAFDKHLEAVAILEKSYLVDEGNIMIAHSLANSLESLGDSFAAKKQNNEALSNYNRSLQIEEGLNSKQTNAEFQRKIAQIYYKIGKTKTNIRKQCTEASAAFRKSIEMFNQIQTKSSLSPSNLNIMQESQKAIENSGGC